MFPTTLSFPNSPFLCWSLLLQLNEPALVEGLVLINVDSCAKGWMDWAATKVGTLSISMQRHITVHQT